MSRHRPGAPIVFYRDQHKPPLTVDADNSRGARCLNSGLSLRLHPYFMPVSSEGSGESDRLLRIGLLLRLFVAGQCDKNQNGMYFQFWVGYPEL